MSAKGCINCGVTDNGGYETEDVGPFCGECWGRLDEYFRRPYLPHPFISLRAVEDQGMCEVCGDGESAALHQPAAEGVVVPRPHLEIGTTTVDGTTADPGMPDYYYTSRQASAIGPATGRAADGVIPSVPNGEDSEHSSGAVVPRPQPPDDARVIHSSEIADDPGGFHGDYVPLEDFIKVEAEVARLSLALQQQQEKYRDLNVRLGTSFLGLSLDIEGMAPDEAIMWLRDALVTAQQELRLSNAVCACGCPDNEHENYGEDGQACDHEDHQCVQTNRAVLTMLEEQRVQAAAFSVQIAQLCDWRPIKTAPKDWRHILVWEANRCWIATWQSAEHRWLEVGSIDSLTLYPTLWVPLPEPPLVREA